MCGDCGGGFMLRVVLAEFTVACFHFDRSCKLDLGTESERIVL